MALFKILKGSSNTLPVSCNEGYCYFCEDTQLFYIDTSNELSGRKVLNAQDAATFCGITLEELKQWTKDCVNTFLMADDGIDALCETGGSLPSAIDNFSVIARHSATTGEFVTTTYLYSGLTWNNMTFTSSNNVIIITTTAPHKLRLSFICTDANAVVATIA